MTAAKRYVDMNKMAGLVQVSLWVPAHNVDTILSLADDMRLNHYNDAIRKNKKGVVEALAMRNKRKLPSLPPFGDAFRNIGSCMQGGFKYDEAKQLHDNLGSCIHEYIDTEMQAKRLGATGDGAYDDKLMLLNAKLYMLAMRAHTLRNQIEALADYEANRPL